MPFFLHANDFARRLIFVEYQLLGIFSYRKKSYSFQSRKRKLLTKYSFHLTTMVKTF